MSHYWFPDNTVLCNFGSVCELELLGKILDGRGQWTGAVAFEAEQSSKYIPALGGSGLEFMAEAITIDNEDEIDHVQHLRRAVFGGTDDEPLKHLGEAETCFLLRERQEYGGSRWITDDQDALEFAKFNNIPTWESWHLMSEAVASSFLDERRAFDLLYEMRREDRILTIPPRPVDLRQ